LKKVQLVILLTPLGVFHTCSRTLPGLLEEVIHAQCWVLNGTVGTQLSNCWQRIPSLFLQGWRGSARVLYQGWCKALWGVSRIADGNSNARGNFFLVVLGFELEPCLQSLFTLLIFQRGSQIFAQGYLQIAILLPTASHIAGMISTDHHTELIDWDGSLLTFWLGLTMNCVPPDLYLLSSWN
jgi:hypothetical protein